MTIYNVQYRDETGPQEFGGTANMRTKEAARYLGVSESMLTKLRMRANRHLGPQFVKIAGCVVYRRKDLDVWLDQNVIGPVA